MHALWKKRDTQKKYEDEFKRQPSIDKTEASKKVENTQVSLKYAIDSTTLL